MGTHEHSANHPLSDTTSVTSPPRDGASGPDAGPATARYLLALTELTDAQVGQPSLLPGWTVGHVVAHLSLNATALGGVLHGAATGTDIPMYPSGEARNADIEERAGWSAAELLRDSRLTADAYADTLAAMTDEAWSAEVRRVPGSEPFPVTRVPTMRLTEVEVHRADLGLDYSPADWPEAFAHDLLDRRVHELLDGPSMVLRTPDGPQLWKTGRGAGPEVTGTVAALAWWLIGRGGGESLVSSTGELPQIGRWR